MLGSLARRERRPLWIALAILTLLAIAAALAMASRARTAALHEAAIDGELLAQTELAPILEPRDLAAPITGSRAQEVTGAIEDQILSVSRVDAVRIYSPAGRIMYAADPAIVGTRPSFLRDLTFEVANGDARTAVRAGMLQTFVPIWLAADGAVVVAEMSQAVGPIAAEASAPWHWLAFALGALFLAAVAMVIVTSLAQPMTMPVQVFHQVPPVRLPKALQAPNLDAPIYQHPGFRAIEEERQVAEERARIAEQNYRSVQEQLKEALSQMRHLEAQLAMGETQLTTNDSEVQALREQLQETSQRLHKAESDNNALRERLALRKHELDEARHKLVAVGTSGDAAELAERLEAAQQRADDLTREMARLEAELEYTTNRLHMSKLSEALRDIDGDDVEIAEEEAEDDLFEHPVIIQGTKLTTPGKVR
jgi:predicted nuclease with TOPRIM domain